MIKQWQAIALWKRVFIGLVVGLILGVSMFYGIGNPALIDGSYQGRYGKLSVSDGALAYRVDETLETVTSISPDDPATEKIIIDVDGGEATSMSLTVFRTQRNSPVLVTKTPIGESPLVGKTTYDAKYEMRDFGIANAGEIAELWIYPFGNAFFRLIKMLVIPLIATTLVAGITAMGDPKKLGTLGVRTLSLYLFTTFFAVSLGLALGTVIKPGAGVNYSKASQKDLAAVEGKIQSTGNWSMVDQLLNIIPSNPIRALADGAVLPTIFFAILLGIGILLAGESGDPVKQFFDSAAEVVMRITMFVMELAPIGVLALMAWVLASKGFSVIANMGKLAFALYLCCLVQIVVVYYGMIVKGILRLPLLPFIRGVADAQSVAFSTSSSSATLPATISCAEKNLGIDKSVAGSVLPLGATINMDGTAIYLGLIALFAAQAIGMELTWTDYFNVALTATLVSIGAAGIPSAGLLLAATVLAVIGVEDHEALLVIAFIFPFDRLLDMMRTVTNVTGDLAVACVIAKSDSMLDEDTFRNVDVV